MYQRALKNLLQLRQNSKLPNEPSPISEHPVEPLPDPEPAPQPGPGFALPEIIPPIPLGPPVPLPDPTEDPFVKHLADLVYAGKVKLL